MKGKTPLSPAIAIAVGLVVLAGYLVDLPLLSSIRIVFVRWAMILAGTALLVGVGNLFLVHWGKAASGEKGSFSSMILVFSLLITVVVAGVFSPTGSWSQWIYQYIQIPVETSLMAVLAIFFIIAAARMLKKRLDIFSIVFVATILVMLAGAGPLFGVQIPAIAGPDGLRSLVTQVPAIAGVRGLLLGVALGTIATGLRLLFAVERPYGG
jgi:hypothetical protein